MKTGSGLLTDDEIEAIKDQCLHSRAIQEVLTVEEKCELYRRTLYISLGFAVAHSMSSLEALIRCALEQGREIR